MILRMGMRMARERSKKVGKRRRLKAMRDWGTDGMMRPKLNWTLSWMDQVTLDPTLEGKSTDP